MKLKGILLVLASVVMALGLSACGSSQSASKDSGTKQASSKEDKQANQALLTQYEANLQTAIRLSYTPFNNLTAMLNQPTFDAAAATTTVQQAEKANQDLKDQLAKVHMPKSLSKDTKTKMSSALADLQTSFDKRSEAIKAAESVKSADELKAQLDAADKAGADSYQSFMDQANAVNKSNGLIETDYTQELQ